MRRKPSLLPSPKSASQSDTPDRDLFCLNYDRCLSRAVAAKWRGFSCSDCNLRGMKREVFQMVRTAVDPAGQAANCDAAPLGHNYRDVG